MCSVSSILQKDQLLAEGDGVSLEIENLYLQSTFDEMPSCSSNEVNAPVRNSAAPSVTVKQGVKERLEQYLLAVSEHLLNSYSLDVSIKNVAQLCVSGSLLCQ